MLNPYYIVAYFTSWSIYARNFNVWNLDYSKLTHINYAFANIQNGVVVLGDQWADTDKRNLDHGDSWDQPNNYLFGNFRQLYELKKKNRALKTGLSIGGWTWSADFSNVAATETARKTFVSSAIKWMLDLGLDFIDLDWKYPVTGGLPGNTYRPEDADNYVLLLKEFRLQFAAIKYFTPKLTVAAPCGPATYKYWKIKEMSDQLDHINLMCYDFEGSWSTTADHQANLYPGPRNLTNSIDGAIKDWLAAGAAPQKLVIGVPFYGRGFAQCNGLGKAFSGGGAGTWKPGVFDYKVLPMSGSQSMWEEATNSAYSYDATKKLLITYDIPRSVQAKTTYLKPRGLGGIMYWEASADYSTSSPLSLLRMAYSQLQSNLDTSTNNLCYPTSKYPNILNTTCYKPKEGDGDGVVLQAL